MPKSVTFDREQVMQDVMELFWKKGYNGTSMQDLVDVTGLNRSSFYNSFGDKFSLFEEALKTYEKQQAITLQKFSKDAKTPKESIVSLFHGVSDDIRSGNQKGCMFTSCTAELGGENQQIHDMLVANKDKVVDSFIILIKQAQELGEISKEKSPETIALLLFTCMQGLRITSMLDPDLEAVTDEILKIL